MKYVLSNGDYTENYEQYLLNMLSFVFSTPSGLLLNNRSIGFTTVSESGDFMSRESIMEDRIKNTMAMLNIPGITYAGLSLDPLIIKINFEGKVYEIEGRN